MAVQIDVREVQGVTVLDIRGAVILGLDGRAMLERVQQLVSQGQTRLLLNLAEVTHIDSAGLGELVACYSHVKKQGGQLKLANATNRFRKIVELTFLQNVLELHPSEPEALASFH